MDVSLKWLKKIYLQLKWFNEVKVHVVSFLDEYVSILVELINLQQK